MALQVMEIFYPPKLFKAATLFLPGDRAQTNDPMNKESHFLWTSKKL
jgi:hypothetical protein